jgi:cardiolipin synthase A/B
MSASHAIHVSCVNGRETHLDLLPASKLGRRTFAAIAMAGLLNRCAAVPDIEGLTAVDVGLVARRANIMPSPMVIDDGDALQQQYDLQRTLSASPIVFGNRVTLLPSGADAFRAIFKAIGEAKKSINLEYFILADVQSDGVRLSDLLLARLRAGVKVNMVYDAFGSRNAPATFFAAVRRAGANVIEFNPLDPLTVKVGWSPNDRDHRKIAVIDGRIGFTGGINLDTAYENPPSANVPADGDTSKAYWLDTAVQIEGPAVAELQKLFFGTWQGQKGPVLDPAAYFPPLARQGVQTIRIVGSSPGDHQPLYYASLLTAMRSARQRVWLCSGYFVPPHQERKELHRIARAGLDVRIIAPAFSDVKSAVYAARAAYGDLLQAGARIYEVHGAVLHAKLAVVDDTWTVVGSSNLDRRSVVFNNEVDTVILGHNTAGQVEGVMRRYMADGHEVNSDKWEHRSVGERLDELKARIWQYWM